MDPLAQQLAELNLLKEMHHGSSGHYGQSPGKKVAPAVPPKPKKSQPQVPQSYSVKAACEPSYSTRLQGSSETSGSYLYSNVPPMKMNYQNTDYNKPYRPPANVRSGDTRLYSNVLPPGGTNHVYSNVGLYGSNPNEELPPPPPQDMQSGGGGGPGSGYIECNPAIEDMPPPPSPVSSSYSELRRATDTGYTPMPSFPPSSYQPDYGTYGGSQASSTYESLYEPINPRPPSQMSSRSNFSLYAPYVSGTQGATAQAPPKEAEVDALTNLLVQSMGGGDSQDIDIYGICVKCGEKVIGETSGCTAMNEVYHIQCFTCCHCAINLQGKPFYALDGKPYCEEDYLNTLEKCSVCMNPILDRILRATGKPYHPTCFTCVVCGKSLDGIPFTVDATNQIHCIEDFHKKFAPRCCVCRQPIMPELGQDETVRVVALDRSFHISCYKCEDCGLVLSSESEGRGCYPLDDHILCKSCNAKRVQALTSRMTTEL